MKTAAIPQIRVDAQLRADLEAALQPGETLTGFVEAAVRRALEHRRVEADFSRRCAAALAEHERTGVAHPADEVLARLEAKVAARIRQLGGDPALSTPG